MNNFLLTGWVVGVLFGIPPWGRILGLGGLFMQIFGAALLILVIIAQLTR